MAISIISLIGLIFSVAGIIFILRKRKAASEESNKKKLFNILIALYCFCAVCGVVFLYTVHFLIKEYPLINGIDLGFFTIKFYAIFILAGAVVALALASHKAVKAGYARNLFEMCFYIAFPAGIIGARIWYVIAEWDKSFAGKPFYHVFETWEGGMAIMGGVVFGALAGAAYMMIKHKEIGIKFAADIAVPGILIAQAIGRWGNFFNIEVYGNAVPISQWSFLPQFIIENYRIGNTNMIHLPLFFIESVINTIGYFVIVYGVGKGLRKVIKKGDLALSYLVWYGTVRLILEPMREIEYQMGNAEYNMGASVQLSIVFIIVGILAIIANHVYEYLVDKKRKRKNLADKANEA